MLDKLFGKGVYDAARRILEERGGDVDALVKEIDEAQLEILFSYIEKNLADDSFEVLHGPLILTAEEGSVAYPLVIGHKNVVYAFLIWPGQWNLDVAREMLALFSLFKKKVDHRASFVVLSPYQAPADVSFFALDSPGTRFHLLNLAEAGVETADKDPVKVFLENFELSFGRLITADIDGLSILDKAAATLLKPLDSQILYSEPVKATVTLMSAFMRHVLLLHTKSRFTDGRHRREMVSKDPSKPGKVLFFDVDYRGKVNNDLLAPGPVRLAGFVRQVERALHRPSFTPEKDVFPFFQWILPTVAKPRRDHPEGMRKLLIHLNDERQAVLSSENPGTNTSVYKIYLCRHCQEYFPKNARIRDFPIATLEAFQKKAHFLASPGKGRSAPVAACPNCRKDTDGSALAYQLLCRFLPDLSWDIQYQLDKDPDGRFIGSYRAVSRKGETKYLGHGVNDQSLHSVFKRHFSAVYQWRALFQWVIENRRIDTATVEDYYHLMAVPPLNQGEKALQLEQMLEPFVMSDREYRQYNLLSVTDTFGTDRTKSFHNWLSDYSQLIVNGSHEAVVFFDEEGFFERALQMADEMGLQYEVKAERVLRFIRGSFARDLDVAAMIPGILIEGILPGEAFYEELSRVAGYLDRVEKILDLLGRVAGKGCQLRYLNSENTVQIKKLDSDESWKLNLDEMVEKFTANPGDFELEIRALLNVKFHESGVCSCGGKSYITVRLMSRDWLMKASAAEHGIVAKEKGNGFEVYFTQCERGHSHIITNKDLKEWRIGFVNLKRKFQQDMALSLFRLKAFAALKNGVPVTVLLGNDAASLSLQPVWIRRAMDKVSQFKADSVNILAPASNLLLIGPKDAPFKLLEDLAVDFSRKHSRQAGKPLDCSFSLNLPKRGVGRIQIESIQAV